MKKITIVLFFWIFVFNVNSQVIKRGSTNDLFLNDSTTFNREVKVTLDGETSYTDYKIISFSNDTTVVDTTLTIQKDYKFNYLRKDDFELLPFHNQGQTYNKLGYSFKNSALFPAVGFTSKQYNYYKIEDIKYYYVPTPTSEIMYRTGLEQGQVLDAFLTMNTSRQFNISIAYKGLRSLGKYRNTLASHGNFRTSFNYHSKNKNYYLRGHFSSFDLLNNENGGLTDQSIGFFESNNTNYTDRARLDVNFTNADNMFEGKRYYFEQKIKLNPKKNKSEKVVKNEAIKLQKKKIPSKKPAFNNDSISNKTPVVKGKLITKDTLLKPTTSVLNDTLKFKPTVIKNDTLKIDTIAKNAVAAKNVEVTKRDSLQRTTKDNKQIFDIKLGHTFMYETKHYRFNQNEAVSLFGTAFQQNIADHTSYQKMDNQVYLQLNAPYLGSLRAKANYYKYNYHYNSILYYDAQTISDRLKGNAIAVGADWDTTFGAVQLKADASSIISGDLTGSSLKTMAVVKKDSVFSFKGFAEFTSKSPEFNKLLYQSGYQDYNWQTNFNNEKIATFGVEFISKKWGALNASYNIIDNYTYFNEDSKPVQANETLNYLKVKASKSITYKKITLENTIMYQKVANGASFFRTPEFVTRNTLYYSNYLFKGRPLYLQTGVTFKYFTAFKANAYNPVLSEFVLQNTTKIGNYPVFDFFANAQIRRTRLFLKVENFSASFTGRNYYSAPSYPYRDLTVRFGLVWNFFI